jgi:4-amino-4-deoxy-L-arabinose transferase-like glycosyltransferase
MTLAAAAWWRSPADQPRWARPVLLALTVLAGFLYSWHDTGNLEIYYAAAVRSMASSWHDFFFAAFDPAGTISIDKLPGALWLQAIAVRILGVHAWALVAPQVVEAMASVLVLYRVVCRLAGPLAGITASAVLVACPATVALDRGNISDTLMVLLLLLAADATVSASLTGRLGSLLLAGFWVGLAFQAKMLEAWLVLPALAVAYLVAAQRGWGAKLWRVGAAGVLTGVVSLSWMALVSLWPASQRPYVDGSGTNSIFSQVFVYNGFGRIDQATPNQLLTKAIGLRLTSSPAGWDRLVSGAYGRDTAWLLPASLIALAACLWAARSPVRASKELGGAVMWGMWLIVLIVAFSASTAINAYYMAALSPAMAALLGTALAQGWKRREARAVRLTVVAVVVVTCGYAAWLLPARGTGLMAGLPVLVVVLGIAAGLALLVRTSPALHPGPVALAAIAVIAVPAVASASIVVKSLGPFDTPFEPAASSAFARQLGAVAGQTRPLLAGLEHTSQNQRYLMATQTSALAAPFIYDSGREVLPIGGFTGSIPEPTLSKLKSLIAGGAFHIVVQAAKVDDPRLLWVSQNCISLGSGKERAKVPGGLRLAVYYCGTFL